MRNDIKNPLFESLLKNVNSYGKEIYEQKAKAPVGEFKGSKDLFEVAYQLGISIVNGLYTTVNSYPDTPYKKTYLKSFPGKLKGFLDQIKSITIEGQKNTSAGTSGEYPGSNIIYQVIKLEDLVRKEIQDFVNGASVDKDYADLLSVWQEHITGGINNYKSSINAIKKQIDILGTKNKVSDTPDINSKLYKGIDSIIEDVEKQIDDELQKGANMFKKNESKTIIGNLIDNKICVGFNDFNRINILEKEERRTRKKKEELIKKLEGILSDINNTVNIINSRLDGGGDDVKGFSSLAMASEFITLNKEAVGLKNELEDKSIELTFDEVDIKSGKYNAVERIYNEVTKKKKLFNETWNNEYGKLSSVKNVNSTNPDIMKYYNNGNTFFSMLASDVNKIKFDAANRHKKEETKKEDKKEPESLLKLSKDIKKSDVKKGKKNSEVWEFQKMVLKKYAENKKISSTKVYKNLKASLDAGQGGYFGPRTEAMVKALKAGLKMTDTSSTITQDLVDKISTVKESFLLEQEFDYDAFNKESDGGGSKSSGNKNISKEDKKNITKDLKGNAEKIIANSPKVSVKDDKKLKSYEEGVEQGKKDAEKKIITNDLSGIGAKENPDYGKNGQQAIASGLGIRFYMGNRALRLFDKKMGNYDIRKDLFTCDDGDTDSLTNLIKTGIPNKYSQSYRDFIIDPIKACKDRINWSKDTISILNQAWKIAPPLVPGGGRGQVDRTGGRSFSKYLRQFDDDSVDNFRTKFVSVID